MKRIIFEIMHNFVIRHIVLTPLLARMVLVDHRNHMLLNHYDGHGCKSRGDASPQYYYAPHQRTR